jgi:hypothetical protein
LEDWYCASREMLELVASDTSTRLEDLCKKQSLFL